MLRRLRFVLYPGFQLLDAAGPIAAFEEAERLSRGSYCCELFSREGGMLASSSGVALATQSFGAADFAEEADTLLVVGGYGVDAAQKDAALVAFLRKQAEQAERLASVCSGALLFAEAGLLTGHTVTTHFQPALS
jgi:transcriptional regulator GlxA family with amidase domain